mgnify:CR=1 FL=1
MATFLRGLLETKAAPKNAVARGMSNSRGGIYGLAIPNTAKWDIEQEEKKKKKYEVGNCI